MSFVALTKDNLLQNISKCSRSTASPKIPSIRSSMSHTSGHHLSPFQFRIYPSHLSFVALVSSFVALISSFPNFSGFFWFLSLGSVLLYVTLQMSWSF